jgi:hypothetical protein
MESFILPLDIVVVIDDTHRERDRERSRERDREKEKERKGERKTKKTPPHTKITVR